MDDLMKCPMCFGGVPRGAVVCRGCKARIEYGIPSWAMVVLVVLSLAFGIWVGAVLAGWLGWVSLFLLLAVGWACLNGLFRHRVVFRLNH